MTARILIVEDEMLVAADLEASLEEMGFQPIGVAADSSTALELARQRPDVALVDVNLLDGATGPRIGERLAEDYNVAVVFLTANPGMLMPRPRSTLGVMSKPTDPAAIGHIVDFAMRRHRGQAAQAPAGFRSFG